ncbi:hypothetical protein PRUPE_1G083800 [Prunus persica]|uniref:ABC1 atypical kinase-like domain-containing protein n=1 Tax=Prunus persica TaxID=3760 RepID=A0A251QU92_PRUPE|nr:hypothetical protein PRUPE_1G083800 [Prunus persica]
MFQVKRISSFRWTTLCENVKVRAYKELGYSPHCQLVLGWNLNFLHFIHADMHPGNIPVRLAQSKSSRKRLFKTKPHVIFLDLGTTAELSKSDKSDFKAVALRDGRTAAECTLKLSKQHKCPDPKAFIEQVEEAFAFWGTPEADLVHPAEYMQQLLEKVRRHRVNVCTFMVTTLALEVISFSFIYCS